MKDFIVQRPLVDRPVYGIRNDNSKVQIGVITCVTPQEWVMYFSDARWQFVSCLEGVPSSTAGTIEEAENFIRRWVEAQGESGAVAA